LSSLYRENIIIYFRKSQQYSKIFLKMIYCDIYEMQDHGYRRMLIALESLERRDDV
jgi:hypothetical protein